MIRCARRDNCMCSTCKYYGIHTFRDLAELIEELITWDDNLKEEVLRAARECDRFMKGEFMMHPQSRDLCLLHCLCHLLSATSREPEFVCSCEHSVVASAGSDGVAGDDDDTAATDSSSRADAPETKLTEPDFAKESNESCGCSFCGRGVEGDQRVSCGTCRSTFHVACLNAMGHRRPKDGETYECDCCARERRVPLHPKR